MGKRFFGRLGGLHAIGKFANLRFASSLVLVGLVKPSPQIEKKIKRSRHVDHGQNDQDPLAGVVFPSGMNFGFIGLGHEGSSGDCSELLPSLLSTTAASVNRPELPTKRLSSSAS